MSWLAGSRSRRERSLLLQTGINQTWKRSNLRQKSFLQTLKMRQRYVSAFLPVLFMHIGMQ